MGDSAYNKSLLKAISVIKSFTLDQPELGITEIASNIGLSPTTAYRILATLTKGGLFEQDPRSNKYRIGHAFYTLGNLYLNTTDFLHAAGPVIKALNDMTSEVVNLAILDGSYVTVVMREESKHALRIGLHVGSTLPAYAHAVGKVLLSELTDSEIDNLYPEEKIKPFTNKTIKTKTELKRHLEEVRKTGVAYNREEAFEGIEAVASLVRDASGKAVAATAIAVPLVRINEARRKKLATLIKMGARLISYRLGYQDLDNPVRDIQEIRAWWEQNQLDIVTGVADTP